MVRVAMAEADGPDDLRHPSWDAVAEHLERLDENASLAGIQPLDESQVLRKSSGWDEPLPEVSPDFYDDASEPLPAGSLDDETQPPAAPESSGGVAGEPNAAEPEPLDCTCPSPFSGECTVIITSVPPEPQQQPVAPSLAIANDQIGFNGPPFDLPIVGEDEPDPPPIEEPGDDVSFSVRETESAHAELIREAEIEYCNIGMRIEAIKQELKGAKQEQKEALERLIEIRNSNPENYSRGESSGRIDGTEPAPITFDNATAISGNSIHLPLGVPLSTVSYPLNDSLESAWKVSMGTTNNRWRTASTADLKFEAIKGIGSKTIDEIIAKYPTVGDLEDLRASSDGFRSGLRGITGIGQKKADAMEDRLLDWLTKNRDAAVFAAARAVNEESYIASEEDRPVPVEMDHSEPLVLTDPDAVDADEPQASEPQPLDSEDYADKSHPEHGAYQSGREAYMRGLALKDNPYIKSSKVAWHAGWNNAKGA